MDQPKRESRRALTTISNSIDMDQPKREPRRALTVICVAFFLVIVSLVSQHPSRFLNDGSGHRGLRVYEKNPMQQLIRGTPPSSSLEKPNVSRRLTLPEITTSSENYTCPDGLVYVHDTVLPDYDSPKDRLIPKVVHVTAKSRCLTPKFAKNVEKWRLPGHSFFFHDDEAIDRFVSQDFKLFPHLSLVMKCITSGAAKADLYRYLLLWEHGGIYTDFDNAPMKGFIQGDAIKDTDDAWFPLEGLGIVAQYFFAASPRHPIMYYSLQDALREIWNLRSIHNNKAPYTTGPHATKMGTIHFLKAAGQETNGYIPAGVYVGMNNRTMTVVGDKKHAHEFVNRNGIPNKRKQYKEMNMKHFSRARGKQKNSCKDQIYYEYVKELEETPLVDEQRGAI